jgi:hypothetical protein
MDKDEAYESLETIRTILDRSTVFTHIAPVSLLFGGGAALLASFLGWLAGWIPSASPIAFMTLWILAFIVALAAGLGLSARRARGLGETFWGRKLQYVLAGFTPALIVSFLLTAALIDSNRLDLVAGVWILTYGLGTLAVGVVLDWEFRAAAWAFMVCGSVALFLLRDYPNLVLGVSFGGVHVALGVFRVYRENSFSWQERRQLSRIFRT